MTDIEKSVEAVRAVIRSGKERTIARTRQFIQASHTGPGMRETAQLIADGLRGLGCQTVEAFETPGNPILFAELNAGANAALIVYLMYDTAPVLDPDAWAHPPFAGDITTLPIGRAMIGRGALARRGPMMAFLDVVQAIKDAGLSLPLNLLFVVEGDENIGSPHLPDFYRAYRQRLTSAAGTLFPAAAQAKDGGVVIHLGAKGMAGFELTCDGSRWGRGPGRSDLHWAHGAWVDSPMWRLTHAMATLATVDGSRVSVDGFYDDVIPISAEEARMVQGLPFNEERQKAELGISQFAMDATGSAAMQRYLYEPTMVFEGIWGSVPPIPRLYKRAIARVNLRLVWNQTAEGVQGKIKAHLARRGFGDIAVEPRYAVSPSKVNPNDPIVQTATAIYRAYGIQPQFWPSQPRTPPVAVFERPYVMFGIGHGGNQADKDEYLLLDAAGPLQGLETLMLSYVQFMFSYGINARMEGRR